MLKAVVFEGEDGCDYVMVDGIEQGWLHIVNVTTGQVVARTRVQ